MPTPSFVKKGLSVLGLLTITTGVAIGVSGTRVTGHQRGTFSLNPDAITAQNVTTSVHTVSGATTGNHVSVSVTAGDLGGSTSTIELRGMVTAADTVTVFYRNVAATSTQSSFNAGASTISIQTWKY